MDIETITIPLSTYIELVDDSRFLNALRCAGVDNWDGYDFAGSLIYNNNHKNKLKSD